MKASKRAKLATRGSNPCDVLGEAGRVATGHVRTPRKYEATDRQVKAGRKISGPVKYPLARWEW